jgi:hypothetical protein
MKIKFETENSEHQTPLGLASFLGDLTEVTRLLNDSASLTSTECRIFSSQPYINWGNYGDPYPPCEKTPLYWAIKGGDRKVIGVILDAHKKQSLEISDFCLKTAAKEGTVETINILIGEGNVSIDTLFSYAFFGNRPDIMQELLNRTAHYRWRDNQSNTLLHQVNSAHANYDEYPLDSVRYLSSLFTTKQELKNAIGNTPLHSAFTFGGNHKNVRVMTELFKIPLFRSMILDKNDAGETILHLSCKMNLSLANAIIANCSESELTLISDEIMMVLNQEQANLTASMERDLRSGFWDGLGSPAEEREINDLIRQLKNKTLCSRDRTSPGFFTPKKGKNQSDRDHVIDYGAGGTRV